MRYILSMLIAVMISITALAQEYEPFKSGKFAGLKAKNGTIVVAADKYNFIGSDFDTYTWVNVGGKSKLKNFPIGGKWGVIDNTGKEVCPPVYDYVAACCNDYVAVNVGGVMKGTSLQGGKWGLYDLKAGKEIIAPTYSAISCVTDDGRLWANQDGKMSYRITGDTIKSKDGKKVVDLRPHFEFGFFYPLNLHVCEVTERGAWMLIDVKGNRLTQRDYSKVFDFVNDYCLVMANGKYGYIDKEGEEVVEPKYYLLTVSNNGRCWAKKSSSSKVFLLDITTDKALTDEKYDSLGMPFYGAVSWVKLNNLYCLVDTAGKQLVDARFKSVSPFVHGVSIVLSQKNAIGAVNAEGQEIVRPIYAKAPQLFGEASQFKSTNGTYCSWFYHPQMGFIWIDQNGKLLLRNAKAHYLINEVVPESLWDY